MIKVYCDFCGKEIIIDKIKSITSLQYPPPYRIEADPDYCGNALPDLCDDCKREFNNFVITERSKFNQVISDYIHNKKHRLK